MEYLTIILISVIITLIFISVILYITIQDKNQVINVSDVQLDLKKQTISDLEVNVKDLLHELKKTNIELHEAHRIINSNNFLYSEYEIFNLKTQMTKFVYENQKEELLNKFMKDYVSKFIIWKESPDKKDMIGELLVYVKKGKV